MTRTIQVHMKWSETIEVEVPDDWPEVSSLEELPQECLHDVRPFDPMTDAVDIDDAGPEDE